MKEFPNLIKHYSILNMQIPLYRKTILSTLNSNIARKGTEYLFKDLKKDITDGREPIEINNTTKFLAVQSGNELLINLEKVYFIYNDFIFNITGTLNVAQNDVELPMSKIIWGHPVYQCHSAPYDTNSLVQALNNFITYKSTISTGFSLTIDWCNKHTWSGSNLISSMTFKDNVLTNIDFTDNPFLLFKNGKVMLDLNFFDKSH